MALRVIRVLDQLQESRGLPEMIRVVKGQKFISRRLDNWCKDNQVILAFIQPGKPTQNAYVERLSGSIRSELLNAYFILKPLMNYEKKPNNGNTIITTNNHTNPWVIKHPSNL
jgi:putative transposase